MKLFIQLIKYDLLLTLRQTSDWLLPLVFFILVASLFPLTIEDHSVVLPIIAPGVIWVAALLATLLSIDRLFRDDFLEGTLEQGMLSPRSNVVYILSKITSHWLVTGLPLLLLSPVVGILFGLSSTVIISLFISILLGTPTLSLIGTIGSALTLGARQGNVLLALLILPLYIPVLIFGTASVMAASENLATGGHFALLGALFFIALALTPIISVAALKVAVE